MVQRLCRVRFRRWRRVRAWLMEARLCLVRLSQQLSSKAPLSPLKRAPSPRPSEALHQSRLQTERRLLGPRPWSWPDSPFYCQPFANYKKKSSFWRFYTIIIDCIPPFLVSPIPMSPNREKTLTRCTFIVLSGYLLAGKSQNCHTYGRRKDDYR